MDKIDEALKIKRVFNWMKPEPDYIRKLFTAFEDAPNTTTNIRELAERGLDYESNEFIFHMRLLEDHGFVCREDGDSGFGLYRSLDGLYSWAVVPLRLTASGHEFAEAMNSEHGFQSVKKSLVTSSLGLMRDIAVTAFKAELARHGIHV